MESIKLDLNDFLRYGCGGGAALLTYVLITHSFEQIMDFEPSGSETTLLIATSYIIGSALYAIHRSLIYPIPMHFFQTKIRGNQYSFCCSWKITKLEKEMYYARWNRKDKSKGANIIQEELTRWGSHSHLLYVMSIAMFVAVLASFVLAIPAPSEPTISCTAVALLASFTLLAAFVNDYRCISMDIDALGYDAGEARGSGASNNPATPGLDQPHNNRADPV